MDTNDRFYVNTIFLSKKTTTTVNGVFIILVFLNHVWQYVAPALGSNWGLIDNLYAMAISWMGQYIVVPFLLFSGYGVTTSILTKGETYVKSLPRARILPTLLNFDIAVIVFIVTNCIIGISCSAEQCSLALIGWESVGNSNWYIFCIICCYFFSCVSAMICKNSRFTHLVYLLVLCVLYVIILHEIKADRHWWYDTILAYPSGVAIALYQDEISAILEKWRMPLAIGLFPLFLIFLFAGKRYDAMYNLVGSVFFALLLVTLLYKRELHIPILNWLGAHLFTLYIYQRLPMLAIATLLPVFVSTHHVMYIATSATITILLAFMMKPLCDKVSSLCKGYKQ